MLLVSFMLIDCSAVMAEDMDVQVITVDDTATQPVSLDDIQIDATAEIPGYGDVTPTSYYVDDCLMVRKPGILGIMVVQNSSGIYSDDEYGYQHIPFNLKVTCEEHGDEEYPWWSEEWVTHYVSGSEAEYIKLSMDILNTSTKNIDYLKDCSVKAVFDDRVEYAGWCYQRDFDLNAPTWISADDNFAIEPYYEGHYVFGCTLPNAVLNDEEKPLRLVITIGDNEITYNIR